MSISIRSALSGFTIRGTSSYGVSGAAKTSGREPLRTSAVQDFQRRAGGMAESLAAMRDMLLELRGSSQRGSVASTASGIAVLSRVETRSVETVQEATQTVLRSGAAIDASTGGFSPQRPSWEGSSTSLLRIRGRYLGTETDTLSFTVTAEATQSTRGELEVTDGAGSVIERFSFNRRDNTLSLKNGLQVIIDDAVGSKLGDRFLVDVAPGEIDVDASFSGRPDERLLTDPKIRTGSFSLNGAVIQVRSQDSIRSVIDAINAAGAGVQARYDSASQRIELVSDVAGAVAISLGDDTSNFLAAMGLDAPEVILGSDAVTREIVTVETADSVALSPGDFFVNGVAIQVGAGDSVLDVVDRINGAGTGAMARVSDDGELRIYARRPGESLSLARGSSGFLDAVQIEAGTYRGEERRGMSRAQAGEVLYGIEAVAERTRALYTEVDGEEYAGSELRRARGQLDHVLALALEEADEDMRRVVEETFGTELGADFFALDTGERDALSAALRRDPGGLLDFLLGEDDEEGMSGVLGALIDTLAEQGEALGEQGTLINVQI